MDYERSEHLRKRKKWIDTLVTSSEEDNVEEVKPNTKIDSSQPIALRFPYLMISDDSGEEEEFKCYCDGINTVMPSIRKKRKHASQEPIVESDKRTIGGNTETNVIGRNGKRKYSSSDNEHDESVHCHTRIKSKRILFDNDMSENSSENKPMRTLDILKTENVPRDSKSSVLVNSSSSTKSLKSVGNTTIQQGVNHSSLVKNSKFLVSSDDESAYDKEIYAVAGKKKINKKLKSNVSRAQRYKRLHVISPSSSDDEDGIVDDNKHHNRLSNKKTKESVHSGLRKNKPNHFISSSSSSSGDDSNTNNVSNQDTRGKNKENKVLPKEIYQNIHPCPNLLNSLKTESQQPTNKKEEVKKPMSLINVNRPTTSSNINSKAWKKIADADFKQKTNPLKQGNTLKITDLKKKFASSNISSVELHKQINEKSLKNNKKIKHLSLGTKNKGYSSKKPTYFKSNHNSNVTQVESDYRENEITNKATTDHMNERKQLPENKYTVNVNVYCNSPQHSGSESNLIPVDSVTSASETLIASENPNVDINLLLHGNNDDNVLAEPNKKIRVSRVNQEIKKPLHQTKSCFTKNNPLQTKMAFKKDITSDENKNENNGTKNVSNSYDVLGSILSEMNNNPFKIDKPLRKHEDIKADDLGWSPNPLFFGRNQGYNLETKPILQTGSLHNKPLHIGPFIPTSANNLVSPSGSELKDTNNTHSGKIKTQQKGSDNSNSRSSVITKFYSTNSKENTGKTNSEQHTVTTSYNTTNNVLWKKQTTDSISSTKNEQAGKDKRSYGKKLILSENVSKNFTSSKSKEVEECNDVRADSRCHQNGVVDQIPDKPANLSNDTQSLTKTKGTTVAVKNSTTSLDNEIVNEMSEKPESLTNGTKSSTEAKSLKDTSVENECSAKDNNTKGIRIKVGGTIFRLPGKPNSWTETIKPTTDDIIPDNCLNNKDNVPSSSSNISTAVNSSTICNPGTSSTNTNLINKHDSKTILDASDDSEDSSDSSDSGSSEDSSDSSDSENQNHSTEEQNANEKSFTKEQLTGQNKIEELKKSTNCDNVKAQLPSTSSSKEIEVIVLSDSSESENSQCKEAHNNTVNRKEEDSVDMSPSNSKCKSRPNEEKEGNIDDSKVKFIGKIRVKSLRELGLEEEKPLAANAIPSGTSGSLTDTSSEQSQLQLNQLKTPIIISPLLQVNQSPMPSISNKSVTTLKDHTGLIGNFGAGRTIMPTKSITHAAKQSTGNGLALKTTKQKLQRKKTTEMPVSLHDERQMVAVLQTKTTEQPLQTELTSKAISEPTIQVLPNKSNDQTVGLLLLLSQNTVSPNVQSLPSQTELAREIEPQQSDSESMETKFISLCDTLFIDLVYHKIPKLVDDLHLVIIHDRLKEERIKNLEQLISPDIIASEKNRAEKDFGETLRIRGQSFVPLLMTIVNKIEKENLQTLVIALYCRIVQHLERIDSRNAEYKFKLKNIIKRMLQKHSSSELEHVLLVFNSDEESFVTNFKFIENLLYKYDVILGERQRDQLQNQPVTHCNQSTSSNENTENVSNSDDREDEVVSNANCPEPPDNTLRVRKPVKKYVVCQVNSTEANPSKNRKMEIISPACNKNNIKSSSSNQNNDESMSKSSIPPQPLNVNLIGNLDSIIFKKTLLFK